jgi:hypothetical protein
MVIINGNIGNEVVTYIRAALHALGNLLWCSCAGNGEQLLDVIPHSCKAHDSHAPALNLLIECTN